MPQTCYINTKTSHGRAHVLLHSASQHNVTASIHILHTYSNPQLDRLCEVVPLLMPCCRLLGPI